MTSSLPPRNRDSRNLADVTRQNKANLKQLAPGFVGGRFPPARPLHPVYDGDEEDDGDDDTTEIAGWNTDRVVVSTAGIVTLPLTYAPIDGTLHVRWDGDDLEPRDWVMSGQSVVVAYPHLHVGDVVNAAYLYYPSDIPGAVVTAPASAILRGATSDSGSNSNALTGLALPADTQIGDLIVVSYATANIDLTNSDPRLTHLGTGGMLIGFATSLADLNITAPGGFGSYWSVACLTFATNAVGWTAAVDAGDSTMAEPDTITLGTIANSGFTVATIWSWHNTVTGQCAAPVGYTEGLSAAVSLASARVDYWLSSDLATSPSGPSTFTGGPGGVATTVVGLIGPSEEV